MKYRITVHAGKPASIATVAGQLLATVEHVALSDVEFQPDGTLLAYVENSKGIEIAPDVAHFDPKSLGIFYPTKPFSPAQVERITRHRQEQWKTIAGTPLARAEIVRIGEGWISAGGRLVGADGKTWVASTTPRQNKKPHNPEGGAA